jgi:hypothetical protein
MPVPSPVPSRHKIAKLKKKCHSCVTSSIQTRNRRNRRKKWSDVTNQRQRLKKLDTAFDFANKALKEEWKVELKDLFSIASQWDPDRVDKFIDDINNGEYWQQKVEKMKDLHLSELRLDEEQVLMAKDEGLISDAVYEGFIRDLKLEKLLPSKARLKKIRQKWNEFVEEKLKIEKIQEGLDPTKITVHGYRVNIRSIVELVLTIVMTFGSKKINNNTLEFKLSLDGRLLNGQKQILVGLIPMNMGFVVSV